MHYFHNESGPDFTEYLLLLTSLVRASVALLFTSTDAMKGIWVKADSPLNRAHGLATS